MTALATVPHLAPPPVAVPPRPCRLPTPRWDPPYDDETGVGPDRVTRVRTLASLSLAEALPLPLATASQAPRPAARMVTTGEPVPPVGPRAATFVRAVLEVLAGDRTIRTLAAVASPELALELGPLVRRARAGRRLWGGSVRSVRVAEPAPGAAEVTAVVEVGPRCAGLALRLEYRVGRWWLTAIEFA